MPPTDEARQKIYAIKDQLRENQGILRMMFREAELKRDAVREEIRLRDEGNKKVRELIEEARTHLKQRDDIQAKVREAIKTRKEVSKDIIKHARAINQAKRERDRLNKDAKGTRETLHYQLNSALYTLLNTELSLKNELIMLETIFDLKRRYGIKEVADEKHQEVVSNYGNIKEIEGNLDHISDGISELARAAQAEHQTAMEIFTKKDEVRKVAEEHHKEFLNLKKLQRELSDRINAQKKKLDDMRKDLVSVQNKAHNWHSNMRKEEEKRQLEGAKKKMNGSGKLDLEDLKVLLNSGELKLDSKDHEK